MSTFGDDLIQSLSEALAHAKGSGPAILHAPVTPREVREHANLTQAQMAPLMGMSLSGYRKWEQGNAPGQRPGRDSSACDRKGAGGRQARIAVSGSRMTRWPGHPVSNQLKLAEKMEVYIRWRISSMHMKNLVPE